MIRKNSRNINCCDYSLGNMIYNITNCIFTFLSCEKNITNRQYSTNLPLIPKLCGNWPNSENYRRYIDGHNLRPWKQIYLRISNTPVQVSGLTCDVRMKAISSATRKWTQFESCTFCSNKTSNRLQSVAIHEVNTLSQSSLAKLIS